MLLKKRKQIPPPEDLTSQVGPGKKKRKRSKTPSKAKTGPTPDNPVVEEDEDDEASSESLEQIVDAVPLRTHFPGITIRKLEAGVSGPSVKKASLGKGKQVLGEEEQVYTRNLKTHKSNVPFVKLSSSEVAGRFNKASHCLITREDMDFLDSMDPAERMEKT